MKGTLFLIILYQPLLHSIDLYDALLLLDSSLKNFQFNKPIVKPVIVNQGLKDLLKQPTWQELLNHKNNLKRVDIVNLEMDAWMNYHAKNAQ